MGRRGQLNPTRPAKIEQIFPARFPVLNRRSSSEKRKIAEGRTPVFPVSGFGSGWIGFVNTGRDHLSFAKLHPPLRAMDDLRLPSFARLA